MKKVIHFGSDDLHRACGILSYEPILTVDWKYVTCKMCLKNRNR